jgi:hydroxymethylbilane synthase
MLEDPTARCTAQTERRILAGLHGGCSIPLGVYSIIENDTIHIHAILCDLSSTRCIRKSLSCEVDKAADGAAALTQDILEEGGKEILEDIRRDKDRQTDNSY